MRLLSRNRLTTLFYFVFTALLWAQYTVPEKPQVLYPVYDEVGILTKEQKDLLNEKLIKFEDSTSTEIEVILIPSTKGEDVNFVAWQFGEAWKIGKKDLNNGIVLLVALDDRTLAIQQGRAVEQYLTAAVAGQIIDYLITPSFKSGDYYTGIDRGTSALMEAVQGKFKPIVKDPSSQGLPSVGRLFVIAIVVIVLLILLSRGGGGGGGYRDEDRDVILSKRGSRSYPGGFFPFPPLGGGGFGGGGFGGGGFGGFGGGGSFGGGGASGGW